MISIIKFRIIICRFTGFIEVWETNNHAFGNRTKKETDDEETYYFNRQ